MRKIRVILLLLPVCFIIACSTIKQSRLLLAPELSEISGIVRVNDTLIAAHNDGGNQPILYFLTHDGTIVHRCFIQGVSNNDWEDIAYDGTQFVYIEDAGNNSNKRTNLSVLKINVAEARIRDSVPAETIAFSYAEQAAFPPSKAELDFDCEALFWKADSLYLITKSRAKPWHGYAAVYALPTVKGTYRLSKSTRIYIGKKGWRKDAVTAADATGSSLKVLTYNRIISYQLNGGTWIQQGEIKLKKRSQTEGLAIDSTTGVLVAAEKHHLLGGPFLIKLRLKWTSH